jgi:hypothetical protein
MKKIIKYLESVGMWRVNILVDGEYKKLGYFESHDECNYVADKYLESHNDECENYDSELLFVHDVPYQLNHIGTDNQRAYSYKNMRGYYFELIRYADDTWAWHLERHCHLREKFLADSRPDLKYDSALKAHDAMVLVFNEKKM